MIPAYMLDCYMKEFDAKIVSVSGTSIELDDTCFYPSSGGQPNDLGTMTANNTVYNVVDVKKSEGKIIHTVDKDGLQAGMSVHGSIDWKRRHVLMRYHTASHILSTIINQQTGAKITGNQLYTDKARIDFSLENFDREFMKSFEQQANSIISQHLPLRLRVLGRKEAFEIPSLVKLQKELPESIQEIRIVDIGSFDHQACGGTHVSNTSEIGTLHISDLENKGKERRRIYFTLNSQ